MTSTSSVRAVILIGLVAALTAIVAVLAALPPSVLGVLFFQTPTDELSQQQQQQQHDHDRRRPLELFLATQHTQQRQQRAKLDNMEESPRRPPYGAPTRVRTATKLRHQRERGRPRRRRRRRRCRRRLEASEASEVSVVSPDEIAGRKWPALYRSRPASAAAASFLYAQSLLLPAFEKAGSQALRSVRGQHHSPVFRLPSPQPRRRQHPSSLGGDSAAHSFSMYDRVSLGAFLNSTTDDSAPYSYYTAPLEDWVPSVADGSNRPRATTSWQKFEVHDPEVEAATSGGPAQGGAGADVSESSSSKSVAMVWLSHAFVVAHAHFDRSHNFLTHVRGRKKLHLWGPSQTALLYPHRELHRPIGSPSQESGPDATSPYYNQQSLVDFEFPDPLLFPDFPRAAATEVVLEEGDVLYIPPFWWHRVEALHDAPPRTQGDEEE